MQFKQYPSYKNSGVEWLGDVPEHWYIFKSNKIFKQSNVRSYESDEQLTASQKYGVIPQSLYMKKEESKVVLALSGIDNFKHVDKNDFVISLRSFQGGIELCFYDGCVSPAYTVLKPNKVINYSFWSYLFKSTIYISVLNTAVDGIREGKTISYTNFGKIYINIPPLSEQAQIANYLDTETARIDNLISKQEKLIELLEEQRKSIISHAVTKGLNPNAPMKDSGVEWLGEVPEHWKIGRLKNLLSINNGSDYKEFEVENSENSYPVYGSGGVFTYSSKYIYDQESVLLGRKGTINKPLYVTSPFWAVDTMFYSQVKQGVHGKYVYYQALGFPYDRYSSNTALPSMTQTDLLNLSVAIPIISEQIEITRFLDNENAMFDNLISKQNQLIEKLKEYRASIISHAVTGKIDVREFGA